jgi:Golgi phosphoprotein 3
LQGYLSFWNDNISYALRGCILIELALRRRIALVRDPNRRRLPLAERIIEVVDDRQTGETILDEALKMMKAQEEVERMGVNAWIDLMSGQFSSRRAACGLGCPPFPPPFHQLQRQLTHSPPPGETWNVLKIGFQLKQVRERLAKGLVDKGVLRTEKRNFLLFDMATHPLSDIRTKESLITRVVSLLTSTTSAVPERALDKEGTQCRVMRAVCLVCAAYTASVLDNAFGRLGYEEREAAFGRCDDVLGEFVVWPLGSSASSNPSSSGVTAAGRRRHASRIASGAGTGGGDGRESILGLVQEVRKEMVGGDEDVAFELVVAVLEVLSKLDSLL